MLQAKTFRHDQDKIDLDRKKLEARVKEFGSLSELLIGQFNELLIWFSIDEKEIEQVRRILLANHPDFGIDLTGQEAKQHLVDLPAYITAMYSNFLVAKSTYEEELAETEIKIENYIKTERQKEIDGKSRDKVGVISAAMIDRELRGNPKFRQERERLKELEFQKLMLEKITKLLENRSYEFQKIIDVESRF